MQEAQFIPETATVGNALQVCLKTHNKLLVVVDEFGATAGVVTMEDVIEHLLGREIFEKDDVAVDMRELARAKIQKQDAAAPMTPRARVLGRPARPVPRPLHGQLRDPLLRARLRRRASCAAAWLLHRYALAGRSLLASARIADFMVAAVVGVVLGGRIGSYILYDGWRSFGTRPVRDTARLGGRDGEPRRHDRSRPGGSPGSPAPPGSPSFTSADLVAIDGPGRALLRPDRQLHQRRALGQAVNGALGRHLPAERPGRRARPPGPAPPLPALRGRARGGPALRLHAVALLAERRPSARTPDGSRASS